MPEIHPKTLARLIEQTGLTRDAFAEKSMVGIATIKRILAVKEGTYHARSEPGQRIADFLRVSLDDLARPPADDDASHPIMPMRRISAMIDGDRALGFDVVEHLYGIDTRTQITLAPLLTALMAEACLDWRRKQLDRIEALAGEIRSLAGSHFEYQVAAARADQRVADERYSIGKRDVFGWDIEETEYDDGYDPQRANTFADFLRQFARDLNMTTVTFYDDDDLGIDGLPRYDFDDTFLRKVTGGDREAWFALRRGHVRWRDIPRDLMSPERREDRIAWIVSRVPAAELAEFREWATEWSTILSDLDAPAQPAPAGAADGELRHD
jgi:transcriptional regulator with XRE-family HTH domain